MNLRSLLEPWVTSPVDCEIVSLEHDSRRMKPGALFLAYPGSRSDGRLFIPHAVSAGASAIVYEPLNCPSDAILTHKIPCIPVPNLALIRGLIASRFYDYPTRAFSVTGVTGTNGKTTIAYQLAEVRGLLGYRAAYMGTLGQGHVDALQSINNTTPDPLSLQLFCYQAKQDGVEALCMEVSSHALHQARVAGVDFTQAIYTNLSHEHLDYHETMQAYADAKAMLFAMPTLQWAIINHDDAYALLMAASVPATCKILTYGFDRACDIQAENAVMSMAGNVFDVDTPWGRFHVKTKTIGRFNVYNSLAVLGSLLAEGYDPSAVVSVMADVRSSPGRMEIVSTKPSVIVDYAHTPDALDNALSTVTDLKPRKLIVVFGCGGDRDKTKRPMMGEVASRYADIIILTSDNPRTEDPMRIIHDIAEGIPSMSNVVINADREGAIHHALKMAEEGDLILIAGKGHEDYQQIGLKRNPFSDQSVVRLFYQGRSLNHTYSPAVK